MERKMYEPTEKQITKWSKTQTTDMPSDEQFKAQWKKAHHGTARGWGLAKRQWIVGQMAQTYEYNLGIWQARVDRLNGLDYQTKLSDDDGENLTAYNLGYYRGYTEFANLAREMGAAYQTFVQKYQN